MKMTEPINLRAHHIKVLAGLMEDYHSLEQLEDFPNSRDLQIGLRNSRGSMARNRAAYGDKIWDFIEDLAKAIRLQKKSSFRIVACQDVICHSPCPFQETCARKDYKPILAAFTKAGISYVGDRSIAHYLEESVEDRDRRVAEESGLVLGKEYHASELFPERCFTSEKSTH